MQRDLVERTHFSETLRSRAVFSPCERYRYLLQRRWDERYFDASGVVCFVMMNPSTADEQADDATIRRCIGYARDWRFSGITIVNAFALRSTDPKGLLTVDDPIGPNNREHIVRAAVKSDLVVCAWGLPPAKLRPQTADVLALLLQLDAEPHALKLTQDGTPAHPLYLSKDLKPFRLGGTR